MPNDQPDDRAEVAASNVEPLDNVTNAAEFSTPPHVLGTPPHELAGPDELGAPHEPGRPHEIGAPHEPGRPHEPAGPHEVAETPEPDPFDNLVLDESFVRGGAYEPPARTRLAIARYGDQETSWRHGGGLHDPAAQGRRGSRRPKSEKPAKRPPPSRLSSRPSSRSANWSPTSSQRGPRSASVSEKLPLIVSIVVVVIAAFLMFR